MATITNQLDPLAFLTQYNQDLNTGVEVVKGNDYMLLNGLRYLMHIPHKIIYWNSNYTSGNVSDEAINKTVQFLSDNQLQGVAVEVNDYSPIWYMSRVFTNPKTSIFSKILFGPSTTLAYALGLYKLFGVDNYDVMSNSVHLRSNDADIGLLYAGQAKDYNLCDYPVLYHMSPILYSMFFAPVGVLQSLQMASAAHANAKNWAIQTTGEEAARTCRVTAPLAYIPVVLQAANAVAIFAASTLIPGAMAYCSSIANNEAQFLGCVLSTAITALAVPAIGAALAALLVHQSASSNASIIRANAINKKIQEQLAKKAA